MDVIMDVNKSSPWAMTGQKCGEILISSDQLIFRSNKTKFLSRQEVSTRELST